MEKKRGRKTSGPRVVDAGFQERPAPPGHLSSEAKEVWETVIKLHPANWLKEEQFPILEHYCVHTVEARFLAEKIADLKAEKNPEDFEARYNRLLMMQERETRASTAMARTLRITNQARYVPHGSEARTNPSNEPWRRKA